MSTKIVDHRRCPEKIRAITLRKGEKFDWSGNIFIVTGYEKCSMEVVHLETGQKHYIGEHILVFPVSVEIHIKAIP